MNKLVVITGGTKGIGRAIVERFAREGFDIITCSRNESGLGTLREEITERYKSCNLYTFQADLSKKESVHKFAGEIKALKQPVEILINNTGRYAPGQIHSEGEGVLEQMIHTNLYSAYYLTRALITDMVRLKHGYIFNICSTASITPYINGGSYCISKFALYGMTKVLREEMKPFNVKVTAILPGATFTPSWDGAGIEEERFMKPEDVADSIFSVYSLSPNSAVEEILIRPQLGDLG